MDIKPLTSFSPYDLALYNYKLVERLKNDASTNESENFLNLYDLIKLIEMNFEKLRENTTLKNFLPILHYTIQLQSSTSVNILIEDHICHMLKKYESNEPNEQIVLQILYQSLISIEKGQCTHSNVTDQLFDTLYNMFLNSRKLLVANILACLQIYIGKFERTDFLKRIWDRILKMSSHFNRAQILVYFIDDFQLHIDNIYNNDHFKDIVKLLLTSGMREDRKSAIYLLKKLYSNPTGNVSDGSLFDYDCSPELITYSWNAYIMVMENLEEKQSHLILPTLETINKIRLNHSWLDLMNKQLLKHNNILVVRWAILNILNNYICNQLPEDTLKDFLQATNSTNLFNYDNFHIPKEKVMNFLNCEQTTFLLAFVDINWKSVPLHFWLSNIEPKHIKDNNRTKEILVKISGRVRALQNKKIRKNAIELMESKFQHVINILNIHEYFTFIESLYNVLDGYCQYDLLISKLKNSNMPWTQKFNNRIYEILTNKMYNHIDIQSKLMDLFDNIPIKKHGWFRFMVVFDFNSCEKQNEFCAKNYGIDFSVLYSKHFTELNQIFSDKLYTDVYEEAFIQEKVVDFYVQYCLKNIEQLDKIDCIPILLPIGGKVTLMHLSKLISKLNNTIDYLTMECFCKELIKYSKHTDFCNKILKNLLIYCNACLTKDEGSKFAELLFRLDLDDSALLVLCEFGIEYLNLEDIIYRLIYKPAVSGDARIELLYEFQHLHTEKGIIKTLKKAMEYLTSLREKSILIQYLLQKNHELSEKKKRYFENSYEHRIKIRIAVAIAYILQISGETYYCKEYWNVILNQNNQLNVTYLFERIIAFSSPHTEDIVYFLNQALAYSASQQVSIIVICYLYCMINWEQIDISIKQKVIDMLLPLTMGANFQTRLYSQFVIYKMLKYQAESKNNESSIPYSDQLLKTIRLTLGAHLNDLQLDIRLDCEADNFLNTEIMLYVTNTPFDEIGLISDDIKETYSNYREQFLKKSTSSQNSSWKNHISMGISDVQRKVNPVNDIIPESSLISYPDIKIKEVMENDIIIVATLIDKLPNLGGIARTCEVLGIKNLVLHSKKCTQESEFRNLSMTAENSLNIQEVKSEELMEFLMQKQFHGFEIVGAEQTAKSKSFVNFIFPKKCIILLGHEKEGIPAKLLSILNHTVEIPQYGMVRSLNVHVTGALFMWEYCKQHIVQS